MDLIEVSEINIGLVLTKRLSPHAVNPKSLAVPYNKILQEILQSNRVDVDKLAMNHGMVINECLHAGKSMNGLGDMANWPKILDETAAMYMAGETLEKLSKKLQNGEQVDWGKIQELSRAAQASLSESLVPLSEIEPGEVPFIKTGWQVLDEHIGGFPVTGLIVVGGRPGVGKTWFMVKTVTEFAKTHPDKNVAVFSLEMIFPEIAARFKGSQILEANRPDTDTQSRMFLCEKPMTAEEIIQTCTTVSNLGLVCIDFADLMIKGEANEGSMAILYKTLALGAKELGCPIILLSQLSRKQGIPKPSDLRYTGLAEALGWMILMLYDPSTDWTVEDDNVGDELPIIDGTAYVIVWKVRGGFREHEDDAPGAIQIPFKGKYGWASNRSKWLSLKKYER